MTAFKFVIYVPLLHNAYLTKYLPTKSVYFVHFVTCICAVTNHDNHSVTLFSDDKNNDLLSWWHRFKIPMRRIDFVCVFINNSRFKWSR